ncbi:MAG: hemolysin family protein [Planctomycetota bacterium]
MIPFDPAGAVAVAADAAALSGPHVGLAFVALIVATLGALVGAALLVYSPTKLARDEAGRKLSERLATTEREYQVVARFLTIGSVACFALLAWFAFPTSPYVAVGVGLFLAVPACGVLPALIAEARAERILRLGIPVLGPLRLLLLWIVVRPTLAIAHSLLRTLRVSDQNKTAEPDEIADDILAAVSDSAQESALPDEEREWIGNIVELKAKTALEVITPRTDMISFPATMPLDEAVRRAIEAGFSRYPVYRDRVDDIVGVFYAKDALALIAQPERLVGGKVGDLVRKPLFVPESLDLVQLLRQFRATKRQMAIVLDEYGGTAGVVTIEDVIEEIVGDIEDEYDPVIEQPIKVVEEGSVIEVSGRTRVDEANEHLEDRIPEGDDYDTVAGWVFTSIGRIPQAMEELVVDGLAIQILEADDRRIGRMRLTLVRPAAPETASVRDSAGDVD